MIARVEVDVTSDATIGVVSPFDAGEMWHDFCVRHQEVTDIAVRPGRQTVYLCAAFRRDDNKLEIAVDRPEAVRVVSIELRPHQDP